MSFLYKIYNFVCKKLNMKRIIPILILLLMVFCSCQNLQDKTSKNGWKLDWSDEFNDKDIDWSVWSKVPRATPDWKKYTSEWDSLYAVEDGKLVLWAVKNTTQTDDTASFLTAAIWGMNKKFFDFGRIEICAKLDCAQGFWPAIWLLPEVPNRQWPQGGEIDIMEHLNFDTIVYQTVHSNYTLDYSIKDKPKSSTICSCTPDEYNVYAVERYNDSIVFFVNDERTLCYSRIDSLEKEQFPFANSPFYVILSAQLGGGWVGEINPKQLPVAMRIDWVRFYEKQK